VSYDNWKTRDDNEPNEQDDKPVFTEAELAAAIEEMRAKCEAIARNGLLIDEIVADIAALKASS
jgi:hypothetical protein